MPVSPYAMGVPSVAVSRFEDLVAYGLRALIAEEPTLELVAWDVPADDLHTVFALQTPDVAILNFGSLATPAVIRDLHRAHPATHLVVLGNRPSSAEAAQLLAFGAAAISYFLRDPEAGGAERRSRHDCLRRRLLC